MFFPPDFYKVCSLPLCRRQGDTWLEDSQSSLPKADACTTTPWCLAFNPMFGLFIHSRHLTLVFYHLSPSRPSAPREQWLGPSCSHSFLQLPESSLVLTWSSINKVKLKGGGDHLSFLPTFYSREGKKKRCLDLFFSKMLGSLSLVISYITKYKWITRSQTCKTRQTKVCRLIGPKIW